jgi:hypothetical protein
MEANIDRLEMSDEDVGGIQGSFPKTLSDIRTVRFNVLKQDGPDFF